jgi:type I site-specific restriction endonuclease
VVRVDIDVDLQGWRPTKGQTDKNGELIDDRIYNQKDFDRTMVIDERTELVAKTITDYLKRTNPMDKTIIFCNDIDHAERMRRAGQSQPGTGQKNDKYVMKITGDDDIGKAQLDNFINPKKAYPVIATTSELMTTGVDAKTCKLVVLDQNIQSMTKFKQIIGRGTRIDERYGKLWFTILDFKKATELFADERFDGIPEKVMDTTPQDIADPSLILKSSSTTKKRPKTTSPVPMKIPRRIPSPATMSARCRKRTKQSAQVSRQRRGRRRNRPARAVLRRRRQAGHRILQRLHPQNAAQRVRLAG